MALIKKLTVTKRKGVKKYIFADLLKHIFKVSILDHSELVTIHKRLPEEGGLADMLRIGDI